MTNTTTNIKELPSSVTITGNKLIVSLPNAKTPVVWQIDLEQAQSSSFTIQEDKKAKSFILISKMQDGTINEIANFNDKQESVDILMEISSNLQNMHTQISMAVKTPDTFPSSKELNKHQSSSKDNKIGAAIALSLIAILIIIWVISASNNLNTVSSESNNNISSSTNTRSSSGVAISADDFLNNR